MLTCVCGGFGELVGGGGAQGGQDTQEWEEAVEALPSLPGVFLSRRQTRLELGEGIAEVADRELLKCCARAVAHNHPAAFDDLF